MAQLQCIVVTPETTVLDELVDFVALPLFDGEIGIAPGHSPMIGRLGYGELRLAAAMATAALLRRRRLRAGGRQRGLGAHQPRLPATAIDATAAAELLREARQRPAHSEELLALRDRAERQARAQIRVAHAR